MGSKPLITPAAILRACFVGVDYMLGENNYAYVTSNWCAVFLWDVLQTAVQYSMD